MSSTLMAAGTPPPITARSGTRNRCPPIGPPTAMAIGSGSSLGDGIGSMRSPGVSRRFTTDAGPASTIAGGGIPGNFVPRPVYAPALVAFIEDAGIGASASVATGPAVGWFPLAPGEVYWPSYTRDPNYIGNVNIANVSATKITEIKTIVAARRTDDPPPQVANQQFVNRSAATVVPARVFADSARVA